MHVRLSRIADLTDRETEAMVRGFEDGTLPYGDLPSMKGFVGYSAAADREHGRVLVMSVWENARVLRDSNRAAQVAREARLQDVASEPIVDEYEVVLWRIGASEPGSYIRLCRVAGLVDKRAKAMVEGFADNVSGIESLPGYEGYVVASNVRDGKVTSISQWASVQDLENSEQVAGAAREQRLLDVKPYRRPLVERYEIVMVRTAADRMARLS
jgi:heme-degrading monooxygenase HmoA